MIRLDGDGLEDLLGGGGGVVQWLDIDKIT